MDDEKNKLQICDNKFVKSKTLDDARLSLDQLKHKTRDICNQAQLTAELLYEQLKETKYRFFRIIDSVNDIIIVKDFENKWKTANIFTQQLFHITPDMYIGKTNLEISKLNSDISGVLFKCTITDNKAWENKESINFTNEFEIYSNKYVFNFVKTPTYDDDNNPYELIIIGRDVSRLK